VGRRVSVRARTLLRIFLTLLLQAERIAMGKPVEPIKEFQNEVSLLLHAANWS
jgi:hypothetical protein